MAEIDQQLAIEVHGNPERVQLVRGIIEAMPDTIAGTKGSDPPSGVVD